MDRYDVASRVAALDRRIDSVADRFEKVASRARRAGAPRIPGDGDGDGIPYENQRRKSGGRMGKSAIDAVLAAHRGMGTADQMHALAIARAAQRGDVAGVSSRVMSGKAGRDFQAAILEQMAGGPKPAPSKPAPAPKPTPSAPSPAPKPAPSKPAPATRSRPKADSGAHVAAAAQVSSREREALQNYTGGMFRALNSRLRAGKGPAREDRADLAAMDAAFSRSKTTADMTVYRGIAGDVSAKLVPGASFQDAAFASTTSDPRIADGFARGPSGEAIMEIRVPKGSKAISVRDLSQFGEAEQEIILNRGGTYRVVDRIEKRGKPPRIVLEYLE